MESAQTTQYTAPTTAKAIIDNFSVTNFSGSVAYISINIVPSGGSVANSNLKIDNVEVGINETYNFFEVYGHVLEAGDLISTIGTGSALSISCSGREIS